jgi:hypothetical protein
MTQIGQYLTSKHEVLSSNTSAEKITLNPKK